MLTIISGQIKLRTVIALRFNVIIYLVNNYYANKKKSTLSRLYISKKKVGYSRDHKHSTARNALFTSHVLTVSAENYCNHHSRSPLFMKSFDFLTTSLLIALVLVCLPKMRIASYFCTLCSDHKFAMVLKSMLVILDLTFSESKLSKSNALKCKRALCWLNGVPRLGLVLFQAMRFCCCTSTYDWAFIFVCW